MIELSCALAPAEPRNSGLRRAGAKAVLVGPPAPPSLPFEVVDSKVRVPDATGRHGLQDGAGQPAPGGRGLPARARGRARWVREDDAPLPVGRPRRTAVRVGLGRRGRRRPGHAAPARGGGARPGRAAAAVGARAARLREQAGAPARALHRLGAAIGARHSPFVLVLDGADRLTGDSIAAVATLVGHIPAGSMIVLSGRVLPELPVAALRARGPLLELGPYELALSRREAEMLLRAARLELEDAEINELVERTEGWAAGLYLTALAARAEGDELADALSVTGADRYLADYFRSEYLSHLAPERLTFLRRTSVLETMSGPLCDAVLAGKGSALELASLEQENLFVVPLDRHRGAYRYHHLFRELLRQELEDREPELVPVLNQRAADWFEAQGDPESTLAYSHAAGNEESAARILSSIAMPGLGGGPHRLGRDVARPLRRRGAPAASGGRGRGVADPRAARTTGASRGLARGGRARASRRPARSKACIDVAASGDVRRGAGEDAVEDEVRPRRARARAPVAPVGAGRERNGPSPAGRGRARRLRLRRSGDDLGAARQQCACAERALAARGEARRRVRPRRWRSKRGG